MARTASRRSRRNWAEAIHAEWYADPEAHVFDGEYWILPLRTPRRPDVQGRFLLARSGDMHPAPPRVLELENVAWGHRALWAPSVVERDGWYCLFSVPQRLLVFPAFEPLQVNRAFPETRHATRSFAPSCF